MIETEKTMLTENDLHSYQQFCVGFIEEKPQCALFLDCGLGKTVVALTAIWHLLYDSFEVSRVLIVAPLRVARDTCPLSGGKDCGGDYQGAHGPRSEDQKR